MKPCTSPALAIAFIFVIVGNSHAGNILISGSDMTPTIQGYLTSMGHTSTIVSSGAFGSTSLTGYDGVWLGWSTTYGTSPGLTANLQSFVNNGGIILAETSQTNSLSFLPGSAGVTQIDNHGNVVTVVDALHPVNAGLTSSTLSGWGNSHHSIFTSTGSLEVLTTTTDGGGGAITLAQAIGSGFLVLTGQDISYHIQYGTGHSPSTGPLSPAGIFLNNVFALEAQAVPEPASMLAWGLIAGVGAVGYRMRKRPAQAVAAL